jgi:hypothetical protein
VRVDGTEGRPGSLILCCDFSNTIRQFLEGLGLSRNEIIWYRIYVCIIGEVVGGESCGTGRF